MAILVLYDINQLLNLKLNQKLFRITILSVLGVWFVYKLYKTAQNDFFLDGIVLLFIGTLGLIIFLWTFLKDHKEFKNTKRIKSYIGTSIGIFFIVTILSLYLYQNFKTNSPTLISGFNDGGFNGFSVDFKTNGKYIMANGSGLGQSYFYGTYSLKDSIITIDKSNIDNCIRSNKLVIRTENYYLKDSIELLKSKANYITQIDATGKEIDKEFRFRVTEDNRKVANK